MKARGQP